MPIPASDARAIFTQTLVDVYLERPKVYGFMRSFFRETVSSTKNISVEVQRGSETVAVDVLRNTEGNRNTFTKSTQRIMEPPYFREYMELTELDLYDRLIGSTSIDEGVFADLMAQALERMQMMVDKIERRAELQCAQALETGIVILANGDNIDFKRKAGSLVNSSSDYFDTSINPYTAFEEGCQFIREKGKAQGVFYNAVMGGLALNALLGNTVFKERNDLKNIALDNILPPQRNSVGASFHGEISAGSYKVRLWTYPEVYQDSDGNMQPYWPAKKVCILPETPRFTLSYAGVPQLIGDSEPIKRGKYIFGEYKDERKKSHVLDVASACSPVMVAIDQAYTFQAHS
jgi:hypothetical protein